MNISEQRTLALHRALARHLDAEALTVWTPQILANIDRLRGSVQGRPHEQNLKRWQELVKAGAVNALRTILTGEDRDCIEMREVSPLSGLIDQDERNEALRVASRTITEES